jgi:hypothetical protein
VSDTRRAARNSDPTTSRSAGSSRTQQPRTPQGGGRDADAALRAQLFASGGSGGGNAASHASGAHTGSSAGRVAAPAAAGGAGPRVRTADEIRQAYGRAPLSKGQVCCSVMRVCQGGGVCEHAHAHG